MLLKENEAHGRGPYTRFSFESCLQDKVRVIPICIMKSWSVRLQPRTVCAQNHDV